jgi:hypothetical protein
LRLAFVLPTLVALVVLIALGPALGETTAPSPPTSCSSTQSGHGVTIEGCSFTLQASPAGNPNYFVIVTLTYGAPNPTTPVRFRCLLGSGATQVAQYGVLRKSATSLTFVSPLASSGGVLKAVACNVDAT